MAYETLKVSVDERGVVQLRLNRPDKHNAINREMLAELTDFAKVFGARSDVRAVVLSGEGESFCAGADLAWMKEQLAADRATRIKEARRLADMMQALNTMPKPLIARVHGQTFGGGIGVLCVSDVVVAASGVKFALTETRLGLIPATIGPYVIARVGEGVARRFFMSGRVFDSDEARALGIVAKVAEPGDLDDAVEREVRPYLSAAPGAVGAAKRLARALGPRIDEALIDETIERLADTWQTEEAREGIEAFFARRKPPWVRK